MDWTTKRGQLNLALVTRNKKKKKLDKQMPVPTKSCPSPRYVKAVQMEPERLQRKICETDKF